MEYNSNWVKNISIVGQELNPSLLEINWDVATEAQVLLKE